MKLQHIRLITFLLTFFTNQTSLLAAQEEVKGLLPEVRLNSENEELNMQKSFNSEIMITKSENKAIDTLKKIIKKNNNPKEKADLLLRLAELYMRRAKSGRFFELDIESRNQLKNHSLSDQKTQSSLKLAISVYEDIRHNYPQFHDMDYVLFNSAMAHSQINKIEKAQALYTQLIANHSHSKLIPDALLELGELYYNQRNHAVALDKFKALDKYPESRAYPYGLYKSAWCYYNLKKTNEGINQLLAVVKQNPAKKDADETVDERKYNLRREALRDLTLFVGETLAPNEVFGFFSKITTEEELGEIIVALSALYESHSRFKEISVYTRQYINAYPHSKQSVKCYSKLIETNETLKQRERVIADLTEMSKFCKKDKVDPTCLDEFRKISLDISKKWWDIWLKNKNNSEFAGLTELAFENLLSVDTTVAPDSKSRFAFAELLFQQNKFEKSSQNYEIVSLQQNLDKTLAHDSLYGALFAIEKKLEKQETAALVEKQKNLSLRYLNSFPNGEHLLDIQYKLGYIAYKQSDYDLSLKYVQPLLTKNKYVQLKLKSEDLVLDILNIKKDYDLIKNTVKNILSNSKNIPPDRMLALKSISEQAHYSQIQIESQKLSVLAQIDQLIAFSKEHSETQLGQNAYWQSISLAFSKNFDVLGANLVLEYLKQYPSDKKKLDALKDATKAFIDSGNLNIAITTMKDLAAIDINNSLQHKEHVCDLLKINNQINDSRTCYRSLLSKLDNKKRSAILVKILQTFHDRNQAEYIQLQNEILSFDIEPYATEILTTQAKDLLAQKKHTQAFNLALKVNARPVEASARAEARLVQASILENEFNSQSIKAQESKLATVISMKTEKLDKAFTAYSSAIKMSTSDKIQLQGLQGIERLYGHYIDSINLISLPDTLSAADKISLKSELTKLIAPFESKRISNAKLIANISKIEIGNGQKIVWSDLSHENTVSPQARYPLSKKMNSYYPQDDSAEAIKKFIENKKYSEAEKMALAKTATPEYRAIGLYYLSLIAESKSEYEKSLWFIEKALAANNTDQKKLNLFNYQKAKVLYSVEDINSAFKYFDKLLYNKPPTPEVSVIIGIKAFSEGDYLKASNEFSRLSTEQLYNYGVDIIHIDSNLLKGDIELAQKLAAKYSSYNPDRLEILLEQARIFEQFILNKGRALEYYQKALSKSESTEQQLWLKKKIEFLKIAKSNQITSYSGGPQ